MVQIDISKLDFRGYADKHFARAEGMARDARYAEELGAFAEFFER